VLRDGKTSIDHVRQVQSIRLITRDPNEAESRALRARHGTRAQCSRLASWTARPNVSIPALLLTDYPGFTELAFNPNAYRAALHTAPFSHPHTPTLIQSHSSTGATTRARGACGR